MNIHLIAVGRLRAGPEATLVHDYLDRFARIGRGFGLPPVTLVEIDERKGRSRGSGGQVPAAAEGDRILRALPAGAAVIALDERGKPSTSPEFAARLAALRDGARDVAFVIGGADGLSDEVRARADTLLGLGPMVWPHLLVRVLLAEQLYRAATILSGSPYHRA